MNKCWYYFPKYRRLENKQFLEFVVIGAYCRSTFSRKTDPSTHIFSTPRNSMYKSIILQPKLYDWASLALSIYGIYSYSDTGPLRENWHPFFYSMHLNHLFIVCSVHLHGLSKKNLQSSKFYFFKINFYLKLLYPSFGVIPPFLPNLLVQGV